LNFGLPLSYSNLVVEETTFTCVFPDAQNYLSTIPKLFASRQLQVSDLDDKENAVSDDNTNKDKQPHQSKLCSEKGKALTTVEVSCASVL